MKSHPASGAKLGERSGSSFDGWTSAHESDLLLCPDLGTATIDTLATNPTVSLFCNVQNVDNTAYSRDPRATALRAEKYISNFSEYDGASIGVELEFHMFDDVRYESGYNKGSFYVDDLEAQYNSAREYENGNLANRSFVDHGLHDLQPADRSRDVREEIVKNSRLMMSM